METKLSRAQVLEFLMDYPVSRGGQSVVRTVRRRDVEGAPPSWWVTLDLDGGWLDGRDAEAAAAVIRELLDAARERT